MSNGEDQACLMEDYRGLPFVYPIFREYSPERAE